MCADCGLKVVGEGSGCTAMDRVFHIACFTCRVCACRLQGKPFYAVEGEPHCQECYLVIMRIYLSFTHMDTFFLWFFIDTQMYLFFLLFSFYACGCGIYRIAWRSAVSVPSRSSTASYALQASLTTRSASRASSATCAWTAFLSRSMPPIASTASMTSTSKQLYPVTFLVLVKNSFLSVLSDYYRKFAPRCSVCHDPIMPEPGQEETVRVVALDRSFHVQCYKCEVFDFYLECFVLNSYDLNFPICFL